MEIIAQAGEAAGWRITLSPAGAIFGHSGKDRTTPLSVIKTVAGAGITAYKNYDKYPGGERWEGKLPEGSVIVLRKFPREDEPCIEGEVYASRENVWVGRIVVFDGEGHLEPVQETTPQPAPEWKTLFTIGAYRLQRRS